MKNVSLIETNTNKVKSWKLLNNSGELIESFGIFSNLLIKRYYTNTRLSYCRNVALFIDYIEDASNIYKDREFTKSFLVNVIESFSDWLLYGESFGNKFAVKIKKYILLQTIFRIAKQIATDTYLLVHNGKNIKLNI